MFWNSTSNRRLAINRSDESKHFMINGDTGTGKSQIIKRLLYYAQACGDTAVILDSKLEFLPEFFDAKRGDTVLSPKDERCPYWHIGGEVTDEADAVSVTRAMYPSNPTNQQSAFFDDSANAISAYLLSYFKPTCSEFGHWLAHPEEIDSRIRNTEHEHTLSRNAAPQRAGILGTMNKAGRPLRMMPVEPADREFFTVRGWSQQRKGWLFLPNTPDTREAMRPLQSMWMDLILLNLLSMGTREDLPRVWIVLDELASLNTLPQLETAITQMRSTNHPIVMGMQNLAQLDHLYGKQSETIFSQAYTKFILATSDGRSAEALAKLIGDVEILRLKETHSSIAGRLGQNKSFTTEEIRKPLIMPSQIQGLADLEGYFLQRGKVVKVSFPFLPPVVKAPGLIPRIIPPMMGRPLDSISVATPAPEPTGKKGFKKKPDPEPTSASQTAV